VDAHAGKISAKGRLHPGACAVVHAVAAAARLIDRPLDAVHDANVALDRSGLAKHLAHIPIAILALQPKQRAVYRRSLAARRPADGGGMRRRTRGIAEPARDAVGGAVTAGSLCHVGGRPSLGGDELQSLPVGYVALRHAASWSATTALC
jgi:hypothetical protein